MRHRKDGRKLGRTSSHRRAMKRNLAAALFEHERVHTTREKAKEVARFAEKLITLAKKGGLHNFRRALSILQDKEMVHKLFNTIGPRYATRPGGYTRILRRAKNRLGDNASSVIFELVGQETSSGDSEAPEKVKVKKATKQDKETAATADASAE